MYFDSAGQVFPSWLTLIIVRPWQSLRRHRSFQHRSLTTSVLRMYHDPHMVPVQARPSTEEEASREGGSGHAMRTASFGGIRQHPAAALTSHAALMA